MGTPPFYFWGVDSLLGKAALHPLSAESVNTNHAIVLLPGPGVQLPACSLPEVDKTLAEASPSGEGCITLFDEIQSVAIQL